MFRGDASLVSSFGPHSLSMVRNSVLNDIKRLLDSIKEAIDQGNFTVKKTSCVFFCYGVCQAHEQNSRAVKVDGGAIGIMDNESELLE